MGLGLGKGGSPEGGVVRRPTGRVADDEGEGPLIPILVVVKPVVGVVGSLSAAGGGTGDDMGDISGVVGSRVAASPPVFDRTPREREE